MKKSPVFDKDDLAELNIGSPSTIDRMEARGDFPLRMTLSPGSRRVFWRRHEVEAWLRERGLELPADPTDRPDEAANAGRRPIA